MKEFDNTEKTILVPVGTRFPKSIHDELKVIAVREGRPLQDILIELGEDYIKKHGNGNPAFTLDQFQDPNMVAYPAVMSDHQKLREWFFNFKQRATDKDSNQLRFKLQEWVQLYKENFTWF